MYDSARYGFGRAAKDKARSIITSADWRPRARSAIRFSLETGRRRRTRRRFPPENNITVRHCNIILSFLWAPPNNDDIAGRLVVATFCPLRRLTYPRPSLLNFRGRARPLGTAAHG